MTDYEKSFIATETVKNLNKYVERIKELRASAEEGDKEDGTEGGESGEDTGSQESEGAGKA